MGAGGPAQRSGPAPVLCLRLRGAGFPLVGAWEGPRCGRERSPAFLWLEPGKTRGVAALGPPGVCGTRGAQAGLERLGRPRRCWRCSRWSCGSATRRARTGGSGCPGRWLTSSSRCWPSSRCVFPHPRPHLPWGQPWSCVLGLTPSGRVLSALRVSPGQCGAWFRDGPAPTAPQGCLLSCSPCLLPVCSVGEGFLLPLTEQPGSKASLRISVVERCRRWAPPVRGPGLDALPRRSTAFGAGSRDAAKMVPPETMPAARRPCLRPAELWVKHRGCCQQVPISSSGSASSGASALGGVVPMALGAGGSR